MNYISLAVVFNWFKTWSLTLSEERRLRVFENRVLRRIFVPKKQWWEDGEDCIVRSFINLHASPNIIRAMKSGRMKWARHVECMGEMRNAYKIFIGIFEGRK
jgi:hypothetical protein